VINGRKGKFSTTVVGSGGLDPDAGAAKFTVKDARGNVIRKKTDFLVDGFGKVNFKNLKPGRYLLKVKYRGNRNFEAGASKARFSV
jgi:hypothetical protein